MTSASNGVCSFIQLTQKTQVWTAEQEPAKNLEMRLRHKAARPFIIYGLLDPATKQYRYVGQSRRGTERPREALRAKHMRRTSNPQLWDWLKSLRITRESASDHFEILEILESPERLCERECHWISALIAEGHPLLNKIHHPSYVSPLRGRRPLYTKRSTLHKDLTEGFV